MHGPSQLQCNVISLARPIPRMSRDGHSRTLGFANTPLQIRCFVTMIGHICVIL